MACFFAMSRPAICKVLAGAFLLCLGGMAPHPSMARPQFPPLTGRVIDGANVIPDAREARLTEELASLEEHSGRQLVVVTVPSLQGEDIADFGYQLGRTWGIGDKRRNDGVLLLIAPTEQKVRIETAYGLEGTLPDGMGFLIIKNDILPRFKAGDMPGGIEAGADAIIRQLTLSPSQARQLASQTKRHGTSGLVMAIVPIVLVLIVLAFFIVPVLIARRGRGRRGSGSWGAPIVWGSGNSGSGAGASSDSESSGGGGFSGGGGSFGGGGASGSW